MKLCPRRLSEVVFHSDRKRFTMQSGTQVGTAYMEHLVIFKQTVGDSFEKTSLGT